MKVTIDKLGSAVELELQSYSDEIKREIASAFKKIGTQCVKKLKKTSPKRFGGYSKSWTQKVTVTDEQVSAVVYNKKYAGLTHLLEHGHAKANGGRVEGIPHIDPVQDFASEEVLDKIVKILEGN